MDNERIAWVFLSHFPDLTPMHFHGLLHAARSAEAVLRMTADDLREAGIAEPLARHWYSLFHDAGQRRWLEDELKQIERSAVHMVTELDDSYPAPLRAVIDRPPVLYLRGLWPPPRSLLLGIVGTRHPSSYGMKVAHQLAADASGEEIGVVSGLAVGIDTVAHEAVLNAKGYTIAVLGNGLGTCYPRSQAALQDQIGREGTVMSEFPMDAAPQSAHFPRRNRIISGLARGVAVVEAGPRSGASITARCAAEQGRDVFAVPGSIYSSQSAGCHRLLKQGAKLLEHIGDVLDEWQLAPRETRAVPAADPCLSPSVPLNPLRDLTALEERVFRLLSAGPVPVDDLVSSLEASLRDVTNTLLSLELKGLIRHCPGQRYAISRS